MPIGLPDGWDAPTDTAARRYLGRRSSTVFPTPPSATCSTRTSYAAANALVEAALRQRGLPRQSFNLFPKIREVDRLAHAEHGDRLVEIHPECAFVAMGGGVRCRRNGRPPEPRRGSTCSPATSARSWPRARPAPGPDDVLDAFAVLWSAERFARGAHLVQGAVEHDRLGLPMRIVT